MKKYRGVYLVEFQDGIKFGMSDDILKRIDSYCYPWNQRIGRVLFVECNYPRKLEQKLKNAFKNNITGRSPEYCYKIDLNDLLIYICNHKNTRPEGIIRFDKLKTKKEYFILDLNTWKVECREGDLNNYCIQKEPTVSVIYGQKY